MMSESIGELCQALSKAQSEIEHAQKDSVNPHFRSKYADLSSVWSACRGPLTKNGLAITQTFDHNEREVVLVTTLVHTSGQFMRSILPIEAPKGSGSQKQGSAITYARRYALAAIVGVVADEDDDGEIAEGRNRGTDSGNRGFPRKQGTELKLNQDDSRGVPSNANQGVKDSKPQNEPDRNRQFNGESEKKPQDISNNASIVSDPNGPIRPGHLRELAETGRKLGWTAPDIVELTQKMFKKESPKDLVVGELSALKTAMSSMTVEQMKQTSFE